MRTIRLLLLLLLPAIARSQELTSIEQVTALGPEYDLVKPMVGTWQVQQRIWLKPGGDPITLPPIIARRKLVGHFLEEVMEPVPGKDVQPFTRTTYLNYNNANQHWEYIVLDTRYPVMMFETSYDNQVKGNTLTLYLPAFVAPPGWDPPFAGRLAKQRRTIEFEGADLNVMKQYWTLPAGKEFLAMEYIYKRRKE
jgi:hypothetical protein